MIPAKNQRYRLDSNSEMANAHLQNRSILSAHSTSTASA